MASDTDVSPVGKTTKPETQIKILNKTFKIIDLFSVEEPAWTLTEIVEQTKLPKTTAHRIINVLRNKKFLSQDPGSDRYRLGSLAIQIGRHAIAQFDVRRIARPLLADIARETKETALLMMLGPSRESVICAEQINNSSSLKMMMDMGLNIPLHAGGSGKCVLAAMHEKEVQHYLTKPLEKLARNTVTDRILIEEELQRIKQRGYAVSNDEICDGSAGIATAFYNYAGDVIGSVGIIGPLDRIRSLDMESTAQLLKNVATEISNAST